jgi:hypothetical protein
MIRRDDMNNSTQPSNTKDRKAILSTLWIFVVLNYLFGDLAMMMFRPAAYQRVIEGMSEGLVLGATVLMEILIAMVLLSRILKHQANRWANIIMGVVATGFAALTLGGNPPAFYIFLSIVEIGCTLFIVWYAWTWPHPETPALGISPSSPA